ncbi:hypoxanthine phosphoribosyltransferase [Desulfurispira natronophila]|uniref:Hypoxanthine phosphoribosyltransferase n=1 Tax=Desulfurispira natronophila TaxID=682562 RepID=A0A7W7Y5B3_9BACT|nr:hypoxanthine phosphoribosyltransferase [Desulfurispira natronophila]MBB5022309.1 hypoxanthine phosphoribosyltransferase [Desulfurispira natronophila]
MKSRRIEPFIDEATIADTVEQLAARIAEDFAGEPLLLLCILSGSFIFTADLARALARHQIEVEVDFMKVSSYEGEESSGTVKVEFDMERSIFQRNVLIVEDIIDTGRTLEHLLRLLQTRQPRELRLCCLLDKPSRRINGLNAHYVGITIDDLFVVGYGLDYMHKLRELPHIGIMSTEE